MENYVYITLLTNNIYVQGVILLNETLKQVKSKYPLIVLITKDIKQEVLDILDYLEIKWKLIDIIEVPNYLKQLQNQKNQAYKPPYNILTKLQIYNQYEYDKICYLDADIMILKNIDFLFEKELEGILCTYNFSYHKKFYKNFLLNKLNLENIINYPKRINAGFLLFSPKQIKINLINFIQQIPIKEFKNSNKVISDEEILQIYLKYYPIKINILNEYFNIIYWPENVPQKINEDIKTKGYFIHFGGKQLKPWNIGNRLFKEKNIIIDNLLINNIPDYSLIYTAIDIIANVIYKIPPNLILNFSKAYIKEIQSN